MTISHIAEQSLVIMTTTDRKLREFARREREILDAALPLLGRDDWLEVTVDQIAAAAEVGKGTVYKHFDSKDEIYGWLALDFHREVVRALRAIDPALDPLTRARAMVRVFWDAYRSRREYQRVVEYTAREGFRVTMTPRLKAGFDDVNTQQGAIYARLLEDGMAQGMFPRHPVPLALLGPQAVVNGLILMIWVGCFDAEAGAQVVDEVTRFMLAGMMFHDRVDQGALQAA